jgi:hypothetical protein
MLKIGRKTLLLILASAALFMAWLLYVPYRPEHLLRAVPANAQILTAHDNLAARWTGLMQNPLLQSLALTLGVDTTLLKTFAADPEVQKWVTRLAARNTVLAYVPRLGAGGRPAWMLASWLGGDSQVLRHQLTWFPLPGFERHAAHNGVPYWTVQMSGLKDGQQIALAFVEGLLIACVGDDNTAILDLLDTSDGLLPSLALARGARLSDYWCLAPAAPDHGWVDTPSFVRPTPGRPAAPPLTISISTVQSNYIEGGLCGPFPLLPAAKTSAKTLECGDLAKFTGNLPMTTVVLRNEAALPLLTNLLGSEWPGMLDVALRLQGTDRAAVFLFGGDFGGKLFGFRIPALVAAIPMRKPEAMLGLMHGQLLGSLGQQYGLRLTARELKAGARTCFVIESAAPGLFGDLPPDERPAFAVLESWFLVASSARSLAALLARYDTSTADNEARTARWPEGLAQARGGGYAWTDTAKLRDELRLVIAAYALKLTLEDPQGAAARRQQLNLWKAWLDALAPLGETRFWLTADGQLAALRFQAGRPER